MRLFSWLRELVAGFFCADRDELRETAAELERELENTKRLAAAAVAQARRSELELREALEPEGAEQADEVRIRQLSNRVEEDRERAAQLIEQYRELRREMLRTLERLGDAAMIDKMNRERLALRKAPGGERRRMSRDDAGDLEAQARAEAVKLDTLDALERNKRPPAPERKSDGITATERARRILAEDVLGTILSED